MEKKINKKLFEVKTPYHHIKIVEDNHIRKMLFGVGLCQEQSAINLKNPNEHVYDYSRLAIYVLFFSPNPKNILILGLGGAVIPNQFVRICPNAHIDILEIDPEVLTLSQKHFNFQESERVKVHIGDAFVTISKLEKKYDIVISDIFTTRYIPFHIMSLEFLKKIEDVMENKSVIAINVCNDHPSFHSHLHTIYEAFGDNLYRIDGPNNPLCSMIFASKGCPYTNKLDKLVIDERILGAKIFAMKNIQAV